MIGLLSLYKLWILNNVQTWSIVELINLFIAEFCELKKKEFIFIFICLCWYRFLLTFWNQITSPVCWGFSATPHIFWSTNDEGCPRSRDVNTKFFFSAECFCSCSRLRDCLFSFKWHFSLRKYNRWNQLSYWHWKHGRYKVLLF